MINILSLSHPLFSRARDGGPALRAPSAFSARPADFEGRGGQIEKRQSIGNVPAYAEVFTALADPTRRHILEALREQPKTVGELAEGQPVSRPAVSQHLKVLEIARLVGVEPHGNRRLYFIKRDGLDDLRRYLELLVTCLVCLWRCNRAPRERKAEALNA